MTDQWPSYVSAVGTIAILLVLVYALATTKRGGSGNGSGWLRRLQREPAAIGGAIGAFVALGAAFGLQLDGEQVGAIAAFVTFLVGFIVRYFVTPAYDPSPEIVAKFRVPNLDDAP